MGPSRACTTVIKASLCTSTNFEHGASCKDPTWARMEKYQWAVNARKSHENARRLLKDMSLCAF